MNARRRALSAVIVVALGGALAAPILVAGAANADNGLTLTNPVGSGTYSGAEVQFQGTADASDTSDIVIRDGDQSDDAILCTTPYVASWSCDGDWVPTAGAHTLTAWQDTRHDTQLLTLSVPAPIVDDLTITIVEGGSFSISGTTTAPNSSINIDLAGGPYSCGPGNYPSAAPYWCGLGGWVGTGTFPISITQVVDGISSVAVTGTLTVLTPGFHLTNPVDGNTVEWKVDPTFAPSGLTDDLVTPIDVSIDGTVPGVCDNIVPASDGTWGCSLAYPRPNEPATHTVIATQGSNNVTVNFDVTYPMPSWSGGSTFNIEEGDAITTFSGTAGYDDGGPINESIHVSISGTGLYCNALVGALSTWSCDINTSALAVNGYDVEAYESYGPISGSILLGALNVATPTSNVPTPTIDTPTSASSYGTVTPLITLGGAYDFNDLASGAGGNLYVLVTDPDGNDTVYCDTFATGHFDYFDAAWTCGNIPLDLGTSHISVQIYDVNDEFSIADTLDVSVGTSGPVAFTSPADDATLVGTIPFAGTGPITGTVEVKGQRVGTALPQQTFCTTAVATDGTWSCPTAAAWGLWDLEAVATDVLGNVTTSPIQQLRINGYPKPSISWGNPANGIWAHAISSNGGSLSIWLYKIDTTTNPGQYTWGAPVDNCPLGVAIQVGCTLNSSAPLAPGIWNVYTQDVWMSVAAPGESVQSSHDDYFYVPATPTLLPILNANNSVTFSVTREVGSTVTVTDVGTGTAVCTVSGTGTGGSCTASPTAGSHQYSARAVSVGFHSNTGTARTADNDYDWFSDTLTAAPLVVPATPPVPAGHGSGHSSTPTPTPTPADWNFTISPSGKLHPGDEVTISGQGVPAGTEIAAELHSRVAALGATVAAADGTFVVTTTIPTDAPAGDHHIVVTMTPPGGTSATREAAVVIEVPEAVPATGDTTTDDPDAGPTTSTGTGDPAVVDRSEPAAPSGITGTVPTVAMIFEQPLFLAVSGGLGLALLFLVALPTELLNSTLSRNHSRLGRGFIAVESSFDRFRDWFIRVTHSRTLAAAILVLVVSIIFGFVDPNFGFDLTSVRLVLSFAIAFFVLSYGTSWLTGLIVRRSDGVGSHINIQPAIVLFAIVGVVIARALDFTPGFLIGLVIGLELLNATRRASLRAVLVQFGLILGLALAAWVGLSVMTAQGESEDFWGALAHDSMTAFVAEGLMAILVASLPLRFLEGRELWSHSKWLWAATYFVIATAFALLVLPTAFAEEPREYGIWVFVLAGYGVLAVLVWFIFTRLDRRDRSRNGEPAEHATKIDTNS